MTLFNNDQEALALTMIGEARGEGPEGMQAVGNVVMNRVAKNTWYGNTPYNVCMKCSDTGIHQFSCWNIKDPNANYLLMLPESDPFYQQACGIAAGVLSGTLPDLTLGATHYKVVGTPAEWAEGKTPCITIGHHEFYNNIS